MPPMTAGILTIIIVSFGKWIKGEELTAKHAVAAAFAIVMLNVLEMASEDLAKAFGLLFVAGAALTYGEPIARTVTK